MKYNSFKDKKISALGMGCMRLPVDKETGKIDYERAQEIIDYAYSHGVNYFDTAYPYHGGESEIFIGEALKKYPRESFFLASKLPLWEVKKEEDIERIFNEQLKKCQVEYFDFYLCHAMNMTRHDEAIKYHLYDFVQRMKKEGKIRYVGFSFHDDARALEKIIKALPWDFAQIQYNYLDIKLQNSDKLRDMLNENNIPIIVMEPVRGGFLANLADEYAAELKAIEPDKSIASWAIRYVVGSEGIFLTLSGMSNMDQVIDNVSTVTDFKYLSESELDKLNDIANRIVSENYIPCTACNYCIDCPKSIYISKVFRFYNEYLVHKSLGYFKECVEKYNIGSCVKCGFCKKHCPQHIDIPKELEKINKILNQ